MSAEKKLDATGLFLDVLTGGLGGRAMDALKVADKTITGLDAAWGGYNLVDGDITIQDVTGGGVDIFGPFLISAPYISDIIGLLLNFSGALGIEP